MSFSCNRVRIMIGSDSFPPVITAFVGSCEGLKPTEGERDFKVGLGYELDVNLFVLSERLYLFFEMVSYIVKKGISVLK